MVIEVRFFMKKMKMKKKKICEIMFYLYLSFCFLHTVTFLHVLLLDVLKRQIEIETESISSSMAIMLDNPWQSLYTQYYRTV